MKTFLEWIRNRRFMENSDQPLDMDYFAKVSDQALDNEYHYGRSTPGTFGYEANKSSAQYAINFIKQNPPNENSINQTKYIEDMAEKIHEGWAVIALSYDDPVYQQKPQKQKARVDLAEILYGKLPEDEKEKDRVVARAILKAYLDITNSNP